MSDPNRDRHERSINSMTWIAFVLAAIAGLISIIYVRPTPAQDVPQPMITRSP
jgi:hypothetical protein